MEKCFPTLPRELAVRIFKVNRMNDFKEAIRKFDKIYFASMSKWHDIETYCIDLTNSENKRPARQIITKSIVYHEGFKLMEVTCVTGEEDHTVSRYVWHPEFRSYEYYPDEYIDSMFDSDSVDEPVVVAG
jgi:hypothetical protein